MTAQKVTVTVDQNVTLKDFFKQIENQSDFKFAFTEQFDTNKKYFTKKAFLSKSKSRSLLRN